MGDGYACVGGRGDGRGDAGHNLEGDFRLGECQCLFSPTPENEGVSSLEPGDDLAFLCPVYQIAVDLLLLHCSLPGSLAHEYQLCAVPGMGEHTGVHQPVIDHYIRFLEAP